MVVFLSSSDFLREGCFFNLLILLILLGLSMDIILSVISET